MDLRTARTSRSPSRSGDAVLGAHVADRFTISGVLGLGSRAVVYEAHDAHANDTCALKLLRCTPDDAPHVRARLDFEAHVLDALPKGLAPRPRARGEALFGDDDASHAPFLALDIARGERLGAAWRERSPAELRALTRALCETIAAIHSAGHVHGDLKPDHVVYDPSGGGALTLVDFGAAAPPPELTPAYAAPERDTSPDGLAPPHDIYALGCLLHWCVTSTPPFAASTLVALRELHAKAPPPPLPSSTPALVRSLVEAALLKDPAERPRASDLVRVARDLES